MRTENSVLLGCRKPHYRNCTQFFLPSHLRAAVAKTVSRRLGGTFAATRPTKDRQYRPHAGLGPDPNFLRRGLEPKQSAFDGELQVDAGEDLELRLADTAARHRPLRFDKGIERHAALQHADLARAQPDGDGIVAAL